MISKNSAAPIIKATYHLSNNDPVQPLDIDFKSPLNLVGVDASNVQLSSVAGHLSLNKVPADVGDYTLQKYLPINLLGVVYYIPLFQPTLSGGSSGPIGIHQGLPQIP